MPRILGTTRSRVHAIFFSILAFVSTVNYGQTITEEQDDRIVQQSTQPRQADDQRLEPDPPLDEREDEPTVEEQEDLNQDDDQIVTQRFITDIIVQGNKTVPDEAILYRIPYRVGEPFSADKTRQLIHNVFTIGDLPFGIGYFKNIKVATQSVGKDGITLIILVEEKNIIDEVIFKGNKNLSASDIKKAIPFEDIPVIDEHDIAKYVTILKKLYLEKNFHDVDIQGYLQPTSKGAVAVVFEFTEHKKSFIKRVYFQGNNHFSSKKLRGLIFTREDWVLGFLNRAGSYQPEMTEADRFVLENFYQSYGFLHASVTDVKVDIDPCTKDMFITFFIEEGDQYTISSVQAPGNDVCDEETLLRRITIKPGQLYSKERIRSTIEDLRLFWGEYGYINADIAPSIQPNEDTKTVDITFYSELGSQVYLNRINIIGNEKTRDRVIRRHLLLEEGELLTTKKMDESRTRVENLGYFDQRDGVNWKINRAGKGLADLDLLVKEVKTGQIHGKIGFGGSPTDITNPNDSFSIGAGISDTNLLGLGLHTEFSVELSRDRRSFTFNLTEPQLFDRPIYLAIDSFFKYSNYEDLVKTEKEIKERYTGATISTGFYSKKLQDTLFQFDLGVNAIDYSKQPRPKSIGLTIPEQIEYQTILDKRFLEGVFVESGAVASQDIRNHPMHPSRGYQWNAYGKVGIPAHTKSILPVVDRPQRSQKMKLPEKLGYWKLDADVSWYTPLIGERDLVLCLHAHAGMVSRFKNSSIPYRELYHIGGPASVRGFTFGEIGPTWNGTESIGGTKAFWLNAELIFPISGDFAMKGAVFYDGGAGWDTPDAPWIDPIRLKNNNFGYRHAVGFGIRLLRPTPVKLDWGFKLDRKKGESASEAHMTMYHNF